MGFAVTDADELVSVRKVEFDPGEGSVGDTECSFESGEKDGGIDGMKGSAKVEEDENAEVVGIRGEEKVIGGFEEGCFGAVVRVESRFMQCCESFDAEMARKDDYHW